MGSTHVVVVVTGGIHVVVVVTGGIHVVVVVTGGIHVVVVVVVHIVVHGVSLHRCDSFLPPCDPPIQTLYLIPGPQVLVHISHSPH